MSQAQAIANASKHVFEDYEAIIKSLPKSREASLAFTRLEECSMWINAAIANMQIEEERNASAKVSEG